MDGWIFERGEERRGNGNDFGVEKAGFNGILKGEMGNWSVIRDRLIGSRQERWDEADLFLERASKASAPLILPLCPRGFYNFI